MVASGCGAETTGTTIPLACAGTGVAYSGAAHSVDLGDLVGNPSSIHVSLEVGQLLFVGANGCAHYQLTPAGEPEPTLEERGGLPAPYAGYGLAIPYEAESTGTAVINVSCSPSAFCGRAKMSIDVSVS
jgi:hypothetical protein